MNPQVTLYEQGMSLGKPGNNKGKAGKRSTVGGWSVATTRRHVKFLRSIKPSDLTGYGYAFTLTVSKAPDTPKEWADLRRAFIKRLERLGAIRIHWLTEWQRRGVPHLHGSVYLPDDGVMVSFDGLKMLVGHPSAGGAIDGHWLQLTSDKYGARRIGQHVMPIFDSLGWAKYIAKHSARGVSHYQRSAENIPPAWQSKTGRMWGYTGDWTIHAPMVFEFPSMRTYWRFRRVVRSWRIADARKQKDARRISSARQMLKHHNKDFSYMMGVSEWIPPDLSLDMLHHAAIDPEQITQKS